MKLSLPFLEKKETASYFLVLVLRHNRASAVIFEENEGNAKIVNSANENFLTSVEDANEEELLNTIDKTISRAESVLPQNVETQKTIFGLKANWIDENNKIKKEYLEKLKKISDELGLIPVGFLVTTEAIAHLLAKDEGAPVSAVLAEIDKNYVSISLLRAGKIIEVKDGPMEGNPQATVDNLLKYFEDAEVLPSRVIIFDGERDLSQDFIGHSWSKTLPFLHLPQITNLEKGFDARAVLSGAATEMGFSVLGEPSRSTRTTPQSSTTPNPVPPPIKTGNLERIDMGNPEGNIANQEADVEAESKTEIDNEQETETSFTIDQNPQNIPEEASSDFFGFVKDKDVKGEEKEIPQKAIEDNFEKVPTSILSEEIYEIPQREQIESSEKKPLPINAALILVSGKKILNALVPKLAEFLSKIPAFKSMPIAGNKIILLPISIIAIFIFLFIFYLTGRSAIVTLSIEGKKVTAEKDVTFSISESTDPTSNTIAAQFVTITQNGSVSTNATGSKDIGTPAKGTVTIFNNNNASVTLPAGSKITSSNNLLFTLDKSVNVASASGDDFTGTTPGKADVGVTAADIGTNFNLPSNTKFTTSQNSVVAKNDNAFSGGTKKTVTVFSKDDASKLENDLKKSLETKAKDEIVNKITNNSILLPTFVSETLSNKSLSKNIGDEAGNVTLKADVEYKSVSYSKEDMVNFAKGVLDIPNGLSLDESNLIADAKDLKISSDSISTTLNISASLIPTINSSELAKKISGKNEKDAQKLLMDIPQVSDVLIKISPNIPLFPKNLPSSSKIKINVNSNG